MQKEKKTLKINYLNNLNLERQTTNFYSKKIFLDNLIKIRVLGDKDLDFNELN